MANGNEAENCFFLCENDERYFSVLFLVAKRISPFSLRGPPARVPITLKAPPAIFAVLL